MRVWLFAFALTVAVELPLVAAFAPRALRRRAAGDSVLANLLTHPLAWLAVTSGALGWWPTELSVFAIEVLIYRGVTRMSWGRAVFASSCANGVTAALSFVV